MTHPDLRKVRSEVRRHRRRHGPRAQIPEKLRQDSVRLAKRHSLSAIANALAVSVGSVRRWKDRCDDDSPGSTSVKPIDFIEIIPQGGFPGSVTGGSDSRNTVEVIRPDGWRLRLSGDCPEQLLSAVLGRFSQEEPS